MRILKLSAVAALCWMYSAVSYGIFDAQLLYGQRTGSFDPAVGSAPDLKGSELKAAVHLSPIPLVPVGFGLSAATVAFEDDSKWPFSDFTGMELGLEVTAWSPVALFGLVPYGKLNYLIHGAYALESTDAASGVSSKSAYKPSGHHIALGIKWAPLPLVGVLLEYDMGTMDLKADEIKVAGVALPTAGADLGYKTKSILLGVEVGI